MSRRSQIIYVGSVRNFCGFHNFFPEIDGFRIFLNTPGNRKLHCLPPPLIAVDSVIYIYIYMFLVEGFQFSISFFTWMESFCSFRRTLGKNNKRNSNIICSCTSDGELRFWECDSTYVAQTLRCIKKGMANGSFWSQFHPISLTSRRQYNRLLINYKTYKNDIYQKEYKSLQSGQFNAHSIIRPAHFSNSSPPGRKIDHENLKVSVSRCANGHPLPPSPLSNV